MARAHHTPATPATNRSKEVRINLVSHLRQGDVVTTAHGPHRSGAVVDRPVTTPGTSEKTTLELDHDEVQFLYDVLSSIGGDPYGTRRRFGSRISAALHDAGVERETRGVPDDFDPSRSSIRLK